MTKSKTHIDGLLAILVAVLLVGGCMIFASAAFGLLARGSLNITSVVFSHLVMGVGAGLVSMIAATFIDYHVWRTYAVHIFVFALCATALVFVPHIGAMHGGGRRWIVLAGASFQPSEGLKIASIILAAAYFSGMKTRVATTRYGLGGLFAILAGPALILIAQPDIGTLGVVTSAVCAIFVVAGARVRDLLLTFVVAFVAIAVLAMLRPYVLDRVTTFIHPADGQQSQGYQIRQSLIAIGSGGVVGRGFGQGIQKFTYLPEPMGDSIFAVAGEELGFIGTVLIVALFLSLALRGFTIATQVPDTFGSLLAVGISTYLVSEAFINIASMLGVAPLTGIPLTFVSQGGSAMLVSLGSAGILFNVSSNKKRK